MSDQARYDRRERDRVTVPPNTLVPPFPHTHRIPPRFRLLLVCFGLALLAGFLGGGAYIAGERARAEQQRQMILAEFDKRTAARQAADAALQAEVNELVCAVLAGDLNPSARTQALARQLGCAEPPR